MTVPPPPGGRWGISLPPLHSPVRSIGGRTFDFARHTVVMAIVNRTPDSFYDRGRTFALEPAVEAALQAVRDGAEWVDVGGVPFSPEAADVTVQEELDRVLPVVEALRARSDVVVSVDTTSAEVARVCLDAGAGVVNDTSGLRDPALVEVAADRGATVVVAHSLAAPRSRHPRPRYDDVVQDVRRFLLERVAFAARHGLGEDRIVVDPGHYLNKNTLHSLELTRRLGEITALGLPTLVAVSNKDFVGETLGRERADRLPGTLAAVALCVALGARVVCAHNVAETVDAVRFTEAVLGLREPATLIHNM